MKKIIFILIILSIYGCGLQRRTFCERKADKVARILKDCPGIIDTTSISDTIIIRDTFRISIPSKTDSTVVDSLLKEYCDALLLQAQSSKGDTVVLRIRDKIYFETSLKKKLGTGERLLVHGSDTIVVGYGVDKYDALSLSIISVKKQIENTKTIDKPCPSCELTLWQDIKQNGFKWFIIFVSGIITGFIILGIIKIL